MSDNNQKKGREKDSFVKPGDESIVSGKSFFLSFGKQKKASSNPLIESEKNKNNAKNNAEQPSKSAPAKKENSDNGAVGDKNGDRKGNFKNGHHGDRNKNRNQNRDKSQNANREQEKKVVKSEVKAEEKASSADREERREKDRNRNSRNGRNNRQQKGKDQVKEAKEVKEIKETKEIKEEKKQDNKPHQNPHNHKKNGQSDRRARDEVKENAPTVREKDNTSKKNGANPHFEEKKRPKHKKEKFVPSVPEESIKTEELLQPIVDRSGIASSPSRGIGMRGTGFGSYMQSGKTQTTLSDADEPRYIDRNRPLAEQIAEQSKPKTYKNHVTENTDTVEVIGVRFREAGKVYYFAPGTNKVNKDQPVIVETARGVEYGFCAIPNRHVSVDNIVPPLKPILRTATADDTERYESNKQLEAGASKIFREKVRALGLEMSLVYVEYTFDNGKLLFYFTADGRVDFRELIKELASAFRTRIELRQIGVRDEAKIVGGLGICGRPVCCKSFLGEFSQVSIKMAKDQNLFINSSKISGTCGRFMCCIRYEDEVYQKEYERTPKVDAMVETPDGKGVVVESNALKGVVKVLLDDMPDSIAKPFKCTEVKLLGYLKKNDNNEIPDDAEEIPEE